MAGEGRGGGRDVLVEGKTSWPFSNVGFCSYTLNHVFSVPAATALAAGSALVMYTERYCQSLLIRNAYTQSLIRRRLTPGW